MHRRTACGVLALIVATLGVADTANAQTTRTPEWLRQGFSIKVSHRRDNGEMMQLVHPILGNIDESVVQVISGGRPVALGTIVGADGYVLTKRSELSGGDPIRVRLHDGRLLPARVAAVRRSNDLALLKLDANFDFKPAEFYPLQPPVGSFVITPGRTGRPIGIGSLGVLERRVDHKGRLGVVLGNSTNGRARVQGVWPDSGADEAGIEPEDQIIAINGQEVFNSDNVINTLRGMFPGESVQLTIVRSGNTMEMNAGIREFGILQESENDSRVNGPRNVRLSGFDRVFQHDTVLDPDQCGGPVLDSSGRVIGLNIARAGRVVSYALPSSLVLPEMVNMLQEARGTTN
ncbi:S1C family serine protease [Novipirellula sp. SH528]|uniref:S1C family serine protease n=1 Tax=Novipirellula sp. SH528 TaxID=3454466 RepID=UPI003FA1544E